MKKLIYIFLIYILAIGCEPECRTVIITWYNIDTIMVSEETKRLCDQELDAIIGSPQELFDLRSCHTDTIYSFRSWRYAQ